MIVVIKILISQALALLIQRLVPQRKRHSKKHEILTSSEYRTKESASWKNLCLKYQICTDTSFRIVLRKKIRKIRKIRRLVKNLYARLRKIKLENLPTRLNNSVRNRFRN